MAGNHFCVWLLLFLTRLILAMAVAVVGAFDYSQMRAKKEVQFVF